MLSTKVDLGMFIMFGRTAARKKGILYVRKRRITAGHLSGPSGLLYGTLRHLKVTWCGVTAYIIFLRASECRKVISSELIAAINCVQV